MPVSEKAIGDNFEWISHDIICGVVFFFNEIIFLKGFYLSSKVTERKGYSLSGFFLLKGKVKVTVYKVLGYKFAWVQLK